jgi:hypothetical protein
MAGELGNWTWMFVDSDFNFDRYKTVMLLICYFTSLRQRCLGDFL